MGLYGKYDGINQASIGLRRPRRTSQIFGKCFVAAGSAHERLVVGLEARKVCVYTAAEEICDEDGGDCAEDG